VEEVHHQVAHSNEQLYLDVVGMLFFGKKMAGEIWGNDIW